MTKFRVSYILALGIVVATLTGFSFPKLLTSTPTLSRKSEPVVNVCHPNFSFAQVTLPSSVNLSDDLPIEIKLQGDSLPKSIKIDDASLYGIAKERGGFSRTVDPLFAEIDQYGIYHAKVNLASWASSKNLWPLIEKAQNEWDVSFVETQFSFSITDNQGCRSPLLSAETEIKIVGFTRNNAIKGSPPEILRVESPEQVHLGETFVIRGYVQDQDNDLPISVPVRGYLLVQGVPGELSLPPKMRAIRKEAGIFEATIGPEEFGFYNRLLKFWPYENINLSIHFYIEDQAGHYSNTEKINLSILRS